MSKLVIIGPNDPALNVLAAALEERPELHAELRIIPWEQYRDTLMAGLLSEESPWQAAFVPGHIWLPELAENHLIAPMNPLMAAVPEDVRLAYDAEDIVPAVEKECQYQGQPYLLPLFTDGHILFYRKDVFDIAEDGAVPVISTKAIASMAQKGHQPPHRYGLALKADASEIFTDWLPYLWDSGGRIFNNEGEPDLACAVNVEALEYYCSLRALCPPDAWRYGNAEIADALRRGEAALIATWGGQVAPLFLENPSLAKIYGAAVFSVPWNATWGVGIPENQSQDAKMRAMTTLMQVMGPSIDEAVVVAAGSPVRARTYSSAALARYPWLAAQRLMLERAKLLPADPRLGLFLGDLYAFVHKAFIGEMSPKAALEAVQERAIAALESQKEQG